MVTPSVAARNSACCLNSRLNSCPFLPALLLVIVHLLLRELIAYRGVRETGARSDFERVCSSYEEFSRWISYEGPVDTERVTWHVAESDQRAALYLVDRHPDLLRVAGVDAQAWRERHHEELQALLHERRETLEGKGGAQDED
ncbi:MAG: hypothetical protein GAK36_00138 [Pseudomonas sp.]|nr:MAG: hypothetical protein GAK36_00138 [Pseudomonas sp.]